MDPVLMLFLWQRGLNMGFNPYMSFNPLGPKPDKRIVPPTKPLSQQSSKTCPAHKTTAPEGAKDRSDSSINTNSFTTSACAKKSEGINNELQKLKYRLSTFEWQMQLIKEESRFANFSLFWSKNNQQAIIRKGALELAKRYAAKYEKGSEERIKFWKEMTQQPIFYVQRRASLFHSRDGFTTTVKNIVKNEITPYEKDFKPDERTRCRNVYPTRSRGVYFI